MPPKSLTDPNWKPKEGELTWTRFDKSTARALGIIIRQPTKASSDEKAACQRTDSVYCELDLPDRYAIACLDGEDSHVYVPRHYIKPFDKLAALQLKCMKAKAREVKDLTPWDRDKRKSIKAALKWLDSNESLEAVHDFLECPECCDEGSDGFWKAVKLKRGNANISRKESLEKRRELIKLEVAERDRLVKEREEAKTSKKAKKERSVSGDDDSSSSDSDESGETSTQYSGSSDDASEDETDEVVSSAADEDDEDEDVSEEDASDGPPVRRRKKNRKRKRPYLASTSGTETEEEEEEEKPKKKRKR
ncbi:hypothetical protein GNI_036100 [Gregarina niphandrodes]|uniref:Uncharacterized protein n=1 Tax=Gregarina niphandrodes TaxID=110365 RepID=A0A023BAP2_GRENI|nr:hypothetical protein GNI_036100 [Gregarina niphandrodes]EZG78445.1 hypothetical protein GNI_036100 [Gregarina niphandrodes]|eukprot:XP_011129293.1 hypothetical protein GNI_036100 [Gregarina niphandrodes]